MNYDLTKQGRNYYKSGFDECCIRLLVRGLVFGEGTINDYAEFEQTNEETGWGYKKIVGYGEKMGGHTVVKKKIELMATEITTAQPNTYFKTLWAIHPYNKDVKQVVLLT